MSSLTIATTTDAARSVIREALRAADYTWSHMSDAERRENNPNDIRARHVLAALQRMPSKP